MQPPVVGTNTPSLCTDGDDFFAVIRGSWIHYSSRLAASQNFGRMRVGKTRDLI